MPKTRARGAVRREQRLCGARSLQHADAGHRHHPQEKPVFCSIISQVTPSESSVIKKVAYEPLFLAHLRDQLAIKGVLRVAMHERLTNLRPVIFVQSRPRRRAPRCGGRFTAHNADAELRQGRDRSRTTSIRIASTRCCGRWPIAPTRSRTCSSCPIAAACRARNTAPNKRIPVCCRCHPQAPDGAAGSADPRAYGARASIMGAARPAPAHRDVAWHGYISATGPRPGRNSPSAPPPVIGKCPASKRSLASAAA